MRERTRQRWIQIVKFALISALLGMGFAVAVHAGHAAGLVRGAVSGLTIGFVLSAVEVFVLDAPVGAPVRRLLFLPLLLLRIVVHTAVILVGLRLGEAAGATVHDAQPPIAFWHRVAFAFAVSFVLNTVLVVRRLTGPTLLALVAGRYRRPRTEHRLVLFLDLKESTALTERLGNERFVRLLDAVIFAATEPIVAAGGEIYRYVGDEIIVTWPVRDGIVAPRWIACPFAIEDAIRDRRLDWERDYGAVPAFRAAIHAGPVVVCELGDVRREIVLLGDVMNTTARIADAARAWGHTCLASAEALAGATVPSHLYARWLGEVELRGKAGRLGLFVVERRAG